MDFFSYAAIVVSQWTALLTGSCIAAVLAVLGYFFKYNIPKLWYGVLVSAYFVFATFLAWRTERDTARVTNEQLRAEEDLNARLSAKLERLDERLRDAIAEEQHALLLLRDAPGTKDTQDAVVIPNGATIESLRRENDALRRQLQAAARRSTNAQPAAGH